MALIEDIFKGNLATGLAIGLGAAVLAPTVGRVLRPAAKALIKGSMVFYRETLSEIGEMASDLVAEAQAELVHSSGAETVASDGNARGAAPAQPQHSSG